MKAFLLYRQLRRHGCHSDEAAALTGYALLCQQGDWASLKISRRHARKIRQTFQKFDLDPECLDVSPSFRGEGVLKSGGI